MRPSWRSARCDRRTGRHAAAGASLKATLVAVAAVKDPRVGVKGDRDLGYGSTRNMIAESAVCLLFDATALPGGIWTTAPAMGDKLIARLQANAGLSFAIEA